jgi:hypothetical protein
MLICISALGVGICMHIYIFCFSFLLILKRSGWNSAFTFVYYFTYVAIVSECYCD